MAGTRSVRRHSNPLLLLVVAYGTWQLVNRCGQFLLFIGRPGHARPPPSRLPRFQQDQARNYREESDSLVSQMEDAPALLEKFQSNAEVTQTELWMSLFDQPEQWIDCRKAKKDGSVNSRYPDFKPLNGGKALWVSSRIPAFAKEKLDDGAALWREHVAPRSNWTRLFEDPSSWIDFREAKAAGTRSQSYPDFKHRDGTPLWLEGRARLPNWIQEKIQEGTIAWPKDDAQPPPAVKRSSTELWESLFEHPEQWLDNRGKENPQAPDFKMKDGSGALWLEKSKTPDWVKDELLKDKVKWEQPAPRQTRSRDDPLDLWNNLFEEADRWTDNRQAKKNGDLHPRYPDFKRTRDDGALWISDCPSWAKEQLETGSWRLHETEPGLWSSLFESPEQWRDCREAKSAGSVKANFPDFKRTSPDAVLWIDSKGRPDWALERLAIGDVQWQLMEPPAPREENAGPWQRLFDHPEEWIDFRADKDAGLVDPRYPDFKQPFADRALWLDSKDTPSWVSEKLDELVVPKNGLVFEGGEESEEAEEMSWRSLFEEPGFWEDNRDAKKRGKVSQDHPDFQHAVTDLKLWIQDASIPSWVPEKVNSVDQSGTKIWQDYKSPEEKVEDNWEDLFKQPRKWISFVEAKSSGVVGADHCDFQRSDYAKKELTIDHNWTPEWVQEELPQLEGVQEYRNEAMMWQDLKLHPDDWHDFGPQKREGSVPEKFPDYKHRTTGDALWLKSVEHKKHVKASKAAMAMA